ncbi:MAG: alginate lyase family protein, partial [Spirochaetales bacterium]|nr:alginate lyase family protein [Spirochaetales bacterium]
MHKIDNQKNTSIEQLYILDLSRMVETRERLQSGDESLALSLKNLCRAADKVIRVSPYSVMNKQAIPPSGDKHDYMSLGTYWWPNPGTPDGLPYIRRDGERNPEGDA